MTEYTVRVYPSGDKYWYLNGKWHREDGPAIEHASGGKEWYLNDNLVTEEEHKRMTYQTQDIPKKIFTKLERGNLLSPYATLGEVCGLFLGIILKAVLYVYVAVFTLKMMGVIQ